MTKLFMIIALFVATSANAGPWKVYFQDAKFPTQAMVEHKHWHNPALGAAQTILNAGQTNVMTSTVFSTFAAQPDFPRNLVITPGGTTTQVGAGTATVTGKNIFGQTITEDFTISAQQAGATTGNKAFASISSVLFPATTAGFVTVTITAGDKLGVHRCHDTVGKYVFSEFNGAFETSRGTFVKDATHVESNTFVPNGTMDGAKDVDFYSVENFRCYPVGN